jgi:hypothetical protein
MFTKGVVNKVGVDHLWVLVLGVFNASIAIDLLLNVHRIFTKCLLHVHWMFTD